MGSFIACALLGQAVSARTLLTARCGQIAPTGRGDLDGQQAQFRCVHALSATACTQPQGKLT
eukprot:1616329-Amphidinium_carterae.1